MKKVLIFCFFFLLVNNNSFSQLNKTETDDFDIVSLSIYHSYVLSHATRCAQNALNFHITYFYGVIRRSAY